MSEDWFSEPERRRVQNRPRWYVFVLIILIVANMGVLTYYMMDFSPRIEDLSSEVSSLNLKMEDLQFQLANANYELSSLRNEIKRLRLDNSSIDRPNDRSLLLTEIYNNTARSVVLISVQTQLGGGQGSGFVYDHEGRIITNNHVVEDVVEITVTFIDGTIAPATVVGTDPYIDLAVIDVDVDERILRPLELGNSSELLVGEQVVAIGNPFGLADSMTAGIVSAVDRQMDAPGGYPIVEVIQTDAAINPGNSGGPLLNLVGEVVGMNTAILSETQQFSGVGFAIPSDAIKREVSSLISEGSYQHPNLGIVGTSISPTIAQLMDLPEDTRGALTIEVKDGGPADEAGLRGGTTTKVVEGVTLRIGGDVIIGVDNKPIRSMYDLSFTLERYYRPGETIKLKVIRDKNVTELQLTLGVRPPPNE